MILPSEIQVLVATTPVDFRRQMDGLAALVQQASSGMQRLWSGLRRSTPS
jgi:hypothetical protein